MRPRSSPARKPVSSSLSSRPRTPARRGWRSSCTKQRFSTSEMTGEFVLGDAFARVLTETTQALVCVLDSGGRILLFHDACERATGDDREEGLGRDAPGPLIPAPQATA